MSVSFLPNGNTIVINANTTSGSTVTTVTTGSGQIGSFMIDNVSTNAAIVNIGLANTVTANASAGTGFAVPAGTTKYLNLHITNVANPPTAAYIAASSLSGNAQLIITPAYLFK